MQQPLVAIQAVLPLRKVSTGTSIVVFFQFFGGAFFLAIAQNVFVSRLSKELDSVPGANTLTIIRAGAGAVRQVVKPEILQPLREAYNKAITTTFVCC